MTLQKVLKWVIAVTGSVGALAPLAGILPGKVGATIAVASVVALNINKSLVQAEHQP